MISTRILALALALGCVATLATTVRAFAPEELAPTSAPGVPTTTETHGVPLAPHATVNDPAVEGSVWSEHYSPSHDGSLPVAALED